MKQAIVQDDLGMLWYINDKAPIRFSLDNRADLIRQFPFSYNIFNMSKELQQEEQIQDDYNAAISTLKLCMEDSDGVLKIFEPDILRTYAGCPGYIKGGKIFVPAYLWAQEHDYDYNTVSQMCNRGELKPAEKVMNKWFISVDVNRVKEKAGRKKKEEGAPEQCMRRVKTEGTSFIDNGIKYIQVYDWAGQVGKGYQMARLTAMKTDENGNYLLPVKKLHGKWYIAEGTPYPKSNGRKKKN